VKRTVAVIGTLDTKGPDFEFLVEQIHAHGCDTIVVDTGVVGEPAFAPDVSREAVARGAGTDLAALVEKGDRGEAVGVMARGAAQVVRGLYDEGRIAGVVAMGGGAGTLIGSTAMRALPVGVPKVLVSTVASGDVAAYVGTSDIAMLYSVVDVAGLNRISRRIYANAAGAIAGMVAAEIELVAEKPMVAATMFGNTTRAVNHARGLLEEAGYEVLVFHATGAGGRTMESLIDEGHFAAVLDMTTTEWADEICGGVLSAGPHRLEAAARAGVPQVVVPGCIDMCNFWARDTIPERYRDRTFYEWNPNVTLMRTTVDENRRMARVFAEKLNAATAPVKVLIPLRGVSEIDVAGKPFHAPETIRAFVDTIRAELRADIEVLEIDADINDPVFSAATAETLLGMVRDKERSA
jgi:uncharacterized protein (UPF0261 family)